MSAYGPSAAAINAAARVLAQARAERDSLPPRLAAEAAWWPGGPPVDEIERLICAQRDPAAPASAAASAA